MKFKIKTLAFIIITFIISITLVNTTMALNTNQKIEVNSEGTLRYCLLDKLNDNVEVVLTQDICISESLVIESSLTLNLNNHSLIFTNPTAQILVGNKILVGEIPKEVYHAGHFETKSKKKYHHNSASNNYEETEYYDVWIPGYYTTEYEDKYEYADDIKINIKNGIIKGADGITVKDKESAYWIFDAHGEKGFTPATLFHIISGCLQLEDVEIIAGNGSNGGNATYSEIWHTLFWGGGNGGDGGNGGNGGSIFFIERGVVTVDIDSKLITGKPGKGGNGSKPNPTYWLWSGSTGENGKDGKPGEIVNDSSKLFII